MALVNAYNCPVCLYGNRDAWRPLCYSCHFELPIGMRRGIVRAWRLRVLEPVQFQELCIGARQWLRDARAIRTESIQIGKDIDGKE